MSEQQGRFYLNSDVPIVVNASQEVKHIASGLSTTLLDIAGLKLKPTDELHENVPSIVFDSIPGMEKEAYKLSVTPQLIKITASAPNGFYYGLQTLYQLLPVDVYCKERARNAEWSVPCVEIEDAPTFRYRGAMLDVCRHFASIDYIKKFIDVLAAHKMNTFHWHLTDDQGWRIEIKKHPRLTQIGSKREETLIGHLNDYPEKYDGKPYQGFYTQEQIKDIVNYASHKQITIIPEIDLPGHMQAALASYPELGCTGGPYKVWTKWGISENVLCAGNPKTLQFLDDVFNEIIEMFPSTYIHIGGDECPKTQWKHCPKCQAFIQNQKIKSDSIYTKEQYLQSFIMKHVSEYLKKKNRKTIGWDEILEGNADPQATVMSWRGEAGGVKAAQQGHDVIMTPNTVMYFDFYQALDTDKEPLAIGGYIPIEKVYNYTPIPNQLTQNQQKHIIGVQSNLWTEYIPDFSHVQYMTLPRWAALAEIQWNNPKQKNYNEFLNNKTTTLQAIAIRPEGNSEIYKEQFHFNKATNKPIILKFPADEKYNGQGYGTLVDGISGNTTYGSDKWLGFSNGNDMIATIDLEKETPITSVSLNTCIATGDGIFDAQHICIELSSDGKNYKKTASQIYTMPTEHRKEVKQHTLTFQTQTARYVRISATSEKKLPSWSGLPAIPAFIFVDEISIE